MTNSKKLRHDSSRIGALAIAGTDDWIRVAIASRLRRRGLSVRDYGPGTSSLRQVGTLILVPQLVPRAGNPARNVGLGSNAITLAAAAASDVDDVVLVSLIGADEKQPGHLGALGTVESATHARSKCLTIVRATQICGTTRNLGPLVARARSTLGRDRRSFGDLCCDPVFIGNLVDVVEAAVSKRIVAGCVELTGQNPVTVRDFISNLGNATDGKDGFESNRTGISRWTSVRRSDRALSELLEIQSDLIPKKGSPLQPVLHLSDPLRPPGRINRNPRAA